MRMRILRILRLRHRFALPLRPPLLRLHQVHPAVKVRLEQGIRRFRVVRFQRTDRDELC
jgi:hypothetical protein